MCVLFIYFYLFIFLLFLCIHKKETLVPPICVLTTNTRIRAMCVRSLWRVLVCVAVRQSVRVRLAADVPSFARLRTFLPLKRGKVKITRVMPTVIHYICDSQGAHRSHHMSLITVSAFTHHTHARTALLQSLPCCCTCICMALCVCVYVHVRSMHRLRINLYRLKSSYPLAL